MCDRLLLYFDTMMILKGISILKKLKDDMTLLTFMVQKR
jgi:hypothetical protein